MKRIAPFLLMILALPIHADDGPESVVTAFYSAYAAGDLHTAFGLWEPTAGGPMEKRAERSLRTRCLTVHRVTVGAGLIHGTTATVDAEAVVTISSTAPGALPRIETRFMTFELTRGDLWRITRWAHREEALADRVMGLKSAAERKAVLIEAGRLRTPRLADELCRQALTSRNRGARSEAEEILASAREIALETGDDVALSAVRGIESILFETDTVPDSARSIEAAEDALALARRSGEPDAIARGLMRVGRARTKFGTLIERPPFEEIVALADFVDDATILAYAANQLAAAAAGDRDRRGQIRHALLALQFAELSGHDGLTFHAYDALGEGYASGIHYELALRYFLRAHQVAERSGQRPEAAAGAMLKIAGCQWELGLESEALQTIERTLRSNTAALHTRISLLVTRSYLLVETGDVAGMTRDLEEAQRLLPSNEPGIVLLVAKGHLKILQGRAAEALDLANEATRIAATSSRQAQFQALIATVSALYHLRRFDEARLCFAELRVMLEQERATTALDETHMSNLYAAWADVDGIAVALEVETGNPLAALREAEGMKARGLRAFLERAEHVRSPLMTTEEREREKALNERIVELNREILRPRPGDSRSAEHQSRSAEHQRDIERTRLDLEELRALAAVARSENPLILKAIEDPLELVPEYAVVEYVHTSDALIVIGVLPGRGSARRVIARTIPITQRELSKRIGGLLQLLESRDLRYARAAREMFDLLLDPVRSLIASGQTLCVIPDGALWKVPFQALQAPDGRYLAEITPLFYAPSLALADLARSRKTRPSATPTLLAFANPELHARSVAHYRSAFTGAAVGALPDAEDEVREVARMYGHSHSRVYVGEEATEARLKSQSGRVGVIHFATHGAVDANTPLASAMLLAPGAASEDGVLEAREILDLAVASDLAVLSACSTGGGKARYGEGILGLSWAFLASGCPTTVVSQWNATSSVTSRLMIEFHRHLRAGDSAAKALQKAQNLTRRDHRYRHPYYWAPFVVVGAQ